MTSFPRGSPYLSNFIQLVLDQPLRLLLHLIEYLERICELARRLRIRSQGRLESDPVVFEEVSRVDGGI